MLLGLCWVFNLLTCCFLVLVDFVVLVWVDDLHVVGVPSD